MKKKAVLILYSPRGILEFLWYYCTYGEDYEWTVVCAPYGNMAEQQIETCKNLGVFANIIRDDRDFMNMDMLKKVLFFLKLGFYFILGQRKRMCSNIIRGAIGDLEYELAVISCDFGILPGAFLAQAREKRVVILEDGTADYMEKYKWPKLRRTKNVNDIAGFFLAKMGYANTATCYAMRDTKFCEKFSIYPEKLKYREYKSIERLNDMENPHFNHERFEVLRKRVVNCENELYEGDAILYTTTFYGMTKSHDCVVAAVENYINQNYAGKTVVLKKHPRDNHEYKFAENVKIIEINKNLPMEILAENLKVKESIYMFISTTMLMQEESKHRKCVLYFSELENRSRGEYAYKERFQMGLKSCNIKEENVKVV